MARPSGAVSFARWAIEEFGKVLNERATVRVSQAELARCYGVSPSTVGWYVAELGDAVIQRRPLVFNLS
ncbi:MAG: winged helix-turn-helix domain-containing protein, partial [Acidimicrobiales bacterium]